jgi:hypothetical protein
LGGVTAKVKRVEQDRDAGGRHIDRAGHPGPLPGRVDIAQGEAGCPAAFPVWPPAQAVVSLSVFAASPGTRTLVRVGTRWCAFTIGQFFAHSSNRPTLADDKNPGQSAPPAGLEPATRRLEDVGTESAHVHRCRHRSLDQDFHRTRNRSARGKLHTDLHTSSGSNRPRPAACGYVWGRHLRPRAHRRNAGVG